MRRRRQHYLCPTLLRKQKLNDPLVEGLAFAEEGEVGGEVVDHFVGPGGVVAGEVGGDVAGGEFP